MVVVPEGAELYAKLIHDELLVSALIDDVEEGILGARRNGVVVVVTELNYNVEDGDHVLLVFVSALAI